MKRHTALVVLVSVAVSAAFAADRKPEDPIRLKMETEAVEVPMRMLGVQPAIEVRINDEGPFTFLVDTGAAGNGRINKALAERFELETVGRVLTGDPSGRNVGHRDLVGVPRLSIGGAVFQDIPMLLAGEGSADPGVDGIIGFALFRDLLLTIDYPGKNLSFARGSLPDVDGTNVLAFRKPSGVAEITIEVAGTEVEADIDSGSMGWILLPESVAKTLDFKSEPRVVGRASTGFNEFDIKSAPLKGTVKVGAHEMDDPPIEFADMFPRANVGGQFLQQFTLTFDQANRRVRFERANDKPLVRAPRYRVGVMMSPQPHGLLVRGTMPGSAGEAAGLQDGDWIVALNGQKVSDMDRAALSALFGSPKTIDVRIERGDEVIDLKLTPKLEGE